MSASVAIEPRCPQQLWLDVDRPILTRRRKARLIGRPIDRVSTLEQLELKMAPAPKRPKTATGMLRAPDLVPATIAPNPSPAREPAAIVSAELPEIDPEPTQPFGSWLFDQAKRPGLVGDLAKAAKLDRLFPKNGSIDDVRARFAAAGADGDALMALEDAEREYDRQ